MYQKSERSKDVEDRIWAALELVGLRGVCDTRGGLDAVCSGGRAFWFGVFVCVLLAVYRLSGVYMTYSLGFLLGPG